MFLLSDAEAMMVREKKFGADRITLIKRPKEDGLPKKELAGQNFAILQTLLGRPHKMRGYDYQFYLQCDEILHENSYHPVRGSYREQVMKDSFVKE
jgi:hypothetical protein